MSSSMPMICTVGLLIDSMSSGVFCSYFFICFSLSSFEFSIHQALILCFSLDLIPWRGFELNFLFDLRKYSFPETHFFQIFPISLLNFFFICQALFLILVRCLLVFFLSSFSCLFVFSLCSFIYLYAVSFHRGVYACLLSSHWSFLLSFFWAQNLIFHPFHYQSILHCLIVDLWSDMFPSFCIYGLLLYWNFHVCNCFISQGFNHKISFPVYC
jgi:hypothetical protein